jgi:hypothetical protein
VHAGDSACAWRNLARVSHARNTFACLILGAHQVALDRGARAGDFPNCPVKWNLEKIKSTEANHLTARAEDCSIRLLAYK